MTATDELRHMLDERGVEWETDRSGNRVMWGRPVDQFHDTMEFKAVDNAMPNGGLNVHICGFTPEQAIAATLGRGTCRDVRSADHTIAFECSECGCWVAYDEYWETGIYVLHETGQEHIRPRFCPNCGAEVVE